MRAALVIGLLNAAVLSALLTASAIPLLRRAHVIDIPGGRSLHERPIPRGGGLAVVLAASLSVWAAPLIAFSLDGLPHMSARFDVIMLGLGTILAFALVGLAEDLYFLPALTRFGLQLVLGLLLGLGACLEFGASVWLAPAVAVCSAGLVNVTNFMDGANGLAGGHAVVAAAWFVAVSLVVPVPGLGFVMVAVAGACLGFLPFNAPRARVFLGDSGSYALGGAWSFAATVCLAGLHAVAAGACRAALVRAAQAARLPAHGLRRMAALGLGAAGERGGPGVLRHGRSRPALPPHVMAAGGRDGPDPARLPAHAGARQGTEPLPPSTVGEVTPCESLC